METIDPYTGSVVRIKIPTIHSTGPSSFVVGPGWAVVRPWDAVPGYLIDTIRGNVTPLAGLLRDGLLAFPGPTPETLWVVTSQHEATLVTPAGKSVGAVIKTAANLNLLSAAPDGSGYLLVEDGKRVYDVRPEGDRLLVNGGSVVATGPGRLLVRTCQGTDRSCDLTEVDPATGARRPLGSAPGPNTALTGIGSIAPNSTLAAVTLDSPQPTLAILRLHEGRMDTTSISAQPGSTLVWSPDNRWILIAGTDEVLYAVNASTSTATTLSGHDSITSDVGQVAASATG